MSMVEVGNQENYRFYLDKYASRRQERIRKEAEFAAAPVPLQRKWMPLITVGALIVDAPQVLDVCRQPGKTNL